MRKTLVNSIYSRVLEEISKKLKLGEKILSALNDDASIAPFFVLQNKQEDILKNVHYFQ